MKNNHILKVCQRCKATCCKIGGADLTEKEAQKIINAGYPKHFNKINENHYELKSKRGICPYLSKDNSCSIHKVRPNMCKCWPLTVNFDKDIEEIMIVECPITKLLSKDDIILMKKQLNDVPKEILEGAFIDSKLSKSDLKLIRKRYNNFKRKKLR